MYWNGILKQLVAHDMSLFILDFELDSDLTNCFSSLKVPSNSRINKWELIIYT